MNDKRSVGVAEAAEVLGISVEAVRQRVKRGTLERDEGREGVFVLLPDEAFVSVYEPPEAERMAEAFSARVEELEAELERERQAHAETRKILYNAIEKIPDPPKAIEAPRKSWWRRRLRLGNDR